MEKYIVGNWKMNNSVNDVPAFVKFLKKNGKSQKNMVICVPSTMILTSSKLGKGIVDVGAQNCHYATNGAFTGELSTQMLKEVGAKYVIIGHSERRQYFGETNELLNKKVLSALSSGLKVIYCIGETLEEKSKYKSVLKKQILEGLSNVSNFNNLIIAYEPVWAIGTGKVATVDDISNVHSYILNVIQDNFKVDVPILYGGSVKSSNSAEILKIDVVDGVLIGGASLKADEFLKIAESRG